jgi:hypothetical protein
MRYRKPPIKKTTSRAKEGGSENQSGSNVFYTEYSTQSRIPQEDQYTYNADTCRLKSEYWQLMAAAIDILAVLEISEHGGDHDR